jgi:hypothetical protein
VWLVVQPAGRSDFVLLLEAFRINEPEEHFRILKNICVGQNH